MLQVLSFYFLKNFSCKIKKQNQCFKEELVSIQGRKEAINWCIKYEQDCLREQPNFQKLFLSLNLFEDSQNILQLKGRFGNSLLEYDQKYPIILRGYESLFRRLFIVDAHQGPLHKGIKFTLNCLRLKFWICHGRETVKRVLRNCVVCKQYKLCKQCKLHKFYLPLAQTSQIFELIFRRTHSSLLD